MARSPGASKAERRTPSTARSVTQCHHCSRLPLRRRYTIPSSVPGCGRLANRLHGLGGVSVPDQPPVGYAELEDAGRDFGYVLVTNEFDPARLAAACEMRRQNAPLFTDVVHVNTDGPHAVYAGATTQGQRRGDRSGIDRALGHIDTGRLASLGDWTDTLAGL